jgi:pyruvate dehydrogenase E2 component (dihydrolipoamide acetyltransferase)
MPFTVTMPKLSPTMESGVITSWHKKVGDEVKAGEVILEVSTDKATVEYEALDPGWLRQILVSDGEEAVINQPIAVFTASKDESLEGFEVPKSKPQAAPQQDKVSAEPTAEQTPAAKTDFVGLAQPSFAPEPPLKDYTFQSPREAVEGRVPISPLARKLSREQGLDAASVKGSGPGGRVMSRDLELAQPAADVSFAPSHIPEVPPGSYHEEKLSPMRRVISKRLQEAKTFIPHFYVRRQVDASPMVAAREQLSQCGVKVTYNDFVVRACALALQKHPEVNSAYNAVNGTIVRFETIDISIAVSVPEGLITPIVRHADYKNLGELGVEIRALAARAKSGKLEPHEYKGGSFTVSNLGMYGVDEFSAIINPPQAAILAVGAVLDVPVVQNGAVVAGRVMNLVLSVDHRVVDGVAAAKFLQTLKHYLENPAALLLR